MKKFSVREGFVEPKKPLEKKELSQNLKNKLWNVVSDLYFLNIGDYMGGYSEEFNQFSIQIRHNLLALPIDERSYDPSIEKKFFRSHFFNSIFYEFYEFLEFLISISDDDDKNNKCIGWCNKIFEEELAQFRFVDNRIVSITAPLEIEEINHATSNPWGGIHIQKALELYTKRPKPDYNNSIKESISAVEAGYRQLTGKKHKNIGSAINDLENKGYILHPALKEGFAKIYGWASDENGIRHASGDSNSEMDEQLAKLILVMCSAYVNYLKKFKT